MQTRPPTATRILIAIGFALSCFALALFLWIAFGGSIPLKPESYRITVPFDEATTLAEESDVRISGISVGKVKSIELGENGLAEAELELQESYAPIPMDTQATLRQKTLLGETYVELTPGSEDDETIPEGGTLPEAQVSEAVQLDEIFRTFDEPTRVAFQQWMQNAAVALDKRGLDLNATLGELDPFAEETNRLLTTLDTQSKAVRKLVSNGGVVFDALSERQGQLRGLIENANTVFQTTAQRNADLQETFRIFPTFLRESRVTLARLDRFAADTDPLVQQLRPAAQELSPTLIDLGRLAPQLQRLFRGLGGKDGTITASQKGLPALETLLDTDLPPLLGRLPDYLAEVNPILKGVKKYRQELAAFFANTAAATQQAQPLGPVGATKDFHVLRTTPPLGPETLASFPSRLTSGRTNPYLMPGGYLNLNPDKSQGFFDSFETRQCTGGGLTATISPSVASDPDLINRFQDAPSWPFDPKTPAQAAQEFYENVVQFAFGDDDPSDGATTTALPTPPCQQQDDYQSIGKTSPELSQYLHVYRQGTP
jgi:phospholipid/cholesterol/gamma-HCH transport system substrate-binding protein